MTFDESEVNRKADGKFAEKTGTPAEVSLKPGEIDRGNGIICNPKSSWNFAGCTGCGWSLTTSTREEAEAAVEAHKVDPGFEDVLIEDVGRYKQYTFLKDGVPHRIGAPAIWFPIQPLRVGDYYENGVRHRTDGPSAFNGDFEEANQWWVRGDRVELDSEEQEDIRDDLDRAFLRFGITFEDDEYGNKRDDALAGLQRIVMEKVLNERVAGMEKHELR